MQALSSLVAVAAAIDRAQFLGGHPRGGDLATLVTGLDPGQQPPPGGGGQVLAFRQVIWPQGSARIVAPACQPARLRRVVVLLVRSR